MVMMKQSLTFRIIVDSPLAGVVYAVQRGKSGLLPPVRSSARELVFEFPLVIADLDAEPVRLTGEFAQGPANKRFVYVNTGTLAGQTDSPWTRRAKVPLTGVTRTLLEKGMKTDSPLACRIHGLAKDAGPACATIPLLQPWSVAQAR